MEGDVLVVDETCSFDHADLVVAEVKGVYRLFKFHRVGSRSWLLPPEGGQAGKQGVGRCRRDIILHNVKLLACNLAKLCHSESVA